MRSYQLLTANIWMVYYALKYFLLVELRLDLLCFNWKMQKPSLLKFVCFIGKISLSFSLKFVCFVRNISLSYSSLSVSSKRSIFLTQVCFFFFIFLLLHESAFFDFPLLDC